MTASLDNEIERASSMITVIGSINMDLVVTAKRAPDMGETVMGTSWTQIPGGKGANQAVAAARSGETGWSVARRCVRQHIVRIVSTILCISIT